MAEALKGSDQNELLVPLGFAKDIEFECNSKKELEAQGLLMKKKENQERETDCTQEIISDLTRWQKNLHEIVNDEKGSAYYYGKINFHNTCTK